MVRIERLRQTLSVFFESLVRLSFQSSARSFKELTPSALGLDFREQPGADRFLVAFGKPCGFGNRFFQQPSHRFILPPAVAFLHRRAINFLAHHEAYHVGQPACIRKRLGKEQLVGQAFLDRYADPRRRMLPVNGKQYFRFVKSGSYTNAIRYRRSISSGTTACEDRCADTPGDPLMSLSRPTHCQERLKKSADVLTLIENCRRATGDPGLGVAIERLIVERELHELEQQCSTKPQPGSAGGGRDVVIPVRRIVNP